jgi:hypothetical protein
MKVNEGAECERKFTACSLKRKAALKNWGSFKTAHQELLCVYDDKTTQDSRPLYCSRSDGC